MSAEPGLLIEYRAPGQTLRWLPRRWLIVGMVLSAVSITATTSYYAWLTDHFYPEHQYWIFGVQFNDAHYLWAGPLTATLLVIIGVFLQFLSGSFLDVQRKWLFVFAIVSVLAAWAAIPTAFFFF